jgi:hypothetical protein
VFVCAQANGKVYVAYGLIDPKVQVPACIAFGAAVKQAQALLEMAMGR